MQDVITVGDTISLDCAASMYYYKNDLNWYDGNDNLLTSNESKYLI